MDPFDPRGNSEEAPRESDTNLAWEWGQFPEPFLPPPPLPPPINEPVREKERFASLDILRGAALFGILVVNIAAFALVRDSRYVPHVSGDETGWNYLAWRVTFLGADSKFIQIFTMLFGAGIAVMYSRSRGRWLRRAPYYYLRMLFLLVLGLLHTFVLWDKSVLRALQKEIRRAQRRLEDCMRQQLTGELSDEEFDDFVNRMSRLAQRIQESIGDRGQDDAS